VHGSISLGFAKRTSSGVCASRSAVIRVMNAFWNKPDVHI
jgi:hypothetical protein